MKNKKYASPIKAIRAKCLDCMCGSIKEVNLCPEDGIQSTFCDLYPFRFGKRPAENKKRILTIEQREEIGKRLKKGRENKISIAEHV